MRISKYIKETQVLGPGKRFVIWFQGCKKRCKGCINPLGQKIDGGFEIELKEILKLIKAQKDIQGITISGGEPFLQFEELKELVTIVKQETNLDIMLYSGYTLQELHDLFGECLQEFFKNIDIFIDGRYIEEQDCGNIYRGSDNQKFYFFSEKFQDYKEQMYIVKQRNVEFHIEENDIFMVGIPPKNFYPEFIRKIGDEVK